MLPKLRKNVRENADMNCAISFASLQELRANLDTIPSAPALGFRVPRKGMPVRSLSGIPSGVCPDLVHVLAGARPVNIRALSGILSGLRPDFLGWKRRSLGGADGRQI